MKQKIGKKIVVLFTVCCMLFMGMPVFAATSVEITIGDLSNGVLDLSKGSWTNKEIVIPSTIDDITIKGASTDIPGLTIKIANRNTNLSLTINDLKASGSGNRIDTSLNSATTSLTIKGTNTLNSSDGNGISVYTGNNLIIGGDGTLNIAAGNDAAGIGGRYYTGAGAVKKGNGNIKINSGTLNIQGGNNAAAIGSSNSEDSTSDKLGEIIINGGVITATGGYGGAGIGTGTKCNLAATNIIIKGGIITATGGNGGAGIGSGSDATGAYSVATAYKINIQGGEITAKGNNGGAGIGGGSRSDIGDITISGGKIIKVEGSGTAAGIGGGHEKGIENIIINGTANIKEVIGGNDANNGGAGIGGSGNGTLKNIEIGGSAVIENVIGGPYSAGIGGGAQRGFDTITIKDDVEIIKVIGGTDAAGIGTGGRGYNGSEKIYLLGGEIVEVQGGNNGAGIGAGNQRGFELIKIDGTVIGKVQGGNNAAGIGTGPQGAGSVNEIVINSELYVKGDNSVNIIGGGKERLDLGTVTIKKIIMTQHNMITKVTDETLDNYANVAFCCKNADGTIAKNINFELYNSSNPDDSPKPETNDAGIVYSWVPKAVVETNKKLSEYGYYFKIENPATHEVFYAKEDGRSTYNDGTKEIPLIYVKFAETIIDKSIITPIAVDGSKIIPYSLSAICCEIKLEPPVHDVAYNTAIADYKTAHPGETVETDVIQNHKITLDLQPSIAEPTTFDLVDDVNLIVYKVEDVGGTKKYTYDEVLTSEINKIDVATTNKVYIQVNNVSKTINIDVPAGMRKFNQGYRIDVMCKCTLNEDIKHYIDYYVETIVETNKNKVVKMINTYNIETVTPWEGGLLPQSYPLTDTSNLDVRYNYLTKIS